MAEELEQQTLFEVEEEWKKEWQGMPEFNHVDLQPCASVIVNFETLGDIVKFSHLLEQPMTPNTRSIWYPKAETIWRINKRYINES